MKENYSPKPLLVIADNEGLGEGLDPIRLWKNVEAGEVEDIIHARDAVKSQWGFTNEQVIEHLKTQGCEQYSAILVNWFRRDLVQEVNEIVQGKVPLIQFDYLQGDKTVSDLPVCGMGFSDKLSDILHERLSNNSYNVVFEYTENAGGYEGVRTWTSYDDENHFSKKYDPNDKECVVEKGVTMDRAIYLVSKTPVDSLIKAAIESAKVDGQVNKDILKFKLETIKDMKDPDIDLDDILSRASA